MAQKMRIDRAVDDGEAQPGNEMVFELFPDLCGWSSSCFQICAALVFLFFMVQVQSTQARVCARRSEIWDDQGKEKLTVDS